MAGEQVIVVIGDLHAGGTTAVSPPDYIGVDGNEIQQNALQKKLYEWWLDATERRIPEIVGDRPFVLVLNGDLVEGVHHRTKQVLDTDEATHSDAAVRLLEPVARKASRTYVIRGTEAHVGSLREHAIGSRLGAEPDELGRCARHSLDLRIHDCLLNFTHHIGVTSREYLSAGRLSIAAGTRTLARVWAGKEAPRVWCSAHAHHYDSWSNGSAMTVCGPAWQLPTNYVHNKVPGAKLEVGLYILDWGGMDLSELPVVKPVLYKPSHGIPQ